MENKEENIGNNEQEQPQEQTTESPQQSGPSMSPNKEPGNTTEKGKSSQTLMTIIGGIVVLAVIVLLGWYLFSNNTATDAEGAASVNGAIISQEELQTQMAQQQASLAALGAGNTPDETVLREQALNALISEELLLQAASEAGITVTDEEVNAQIEATRAQFPDEEAFNTALESEGFTEESLREQVQEQLTIQKYINSEIDLDAITVTDEEIQSLYDQVAATQDVPPLSEIRTQVEAQIQQQKEQGFVGQLLEKLRDAANIEIF